MLLLTALTLPLLLGLTSVAVDCGSLYLEKSRLQNAADAASNTYKQVGSYQPPSRPPKHLYPRSIS